jgi:hypothetical protein
MAYDIAGSQILASPVTAFAQGRALRLAERRAEQEGRALELSMQRSMGEESRAQAQEGREQTAFDETMKMRNTQILYRALSQIEAAEDPVAAATAMSQSPEISGMFKQMGKDPLAAIQGKTPDQVRAMAAEGRMKLEPFIGAKEEEAYTLKPGEVRFRGGKKVAEVEPEDEWSAAEPALVAGKEVMVQVNKRTGTPRIVEGVAPIPKDKGDGGDETFKRANILRDEYNTLTKDFETISSGYRNILSAAEQPSAAGDIALVYGFMKLQDPGSTVREGEYATAENAGGVSSRIRAQYNKALSGERLAPEVRKDFVAQAKRLYKGQTERYDQKRSRYADLAARSGLDPADVIGKPVTIQATEAAPPASAPTATGPNGQKLILRNGKWVPLNGR